MFWLVGILAHLYCAFLLACSCRSTKLVTITERHERFRDRQCLLPRVLASSPLVAVLGVVALYDTVQVIGAWTNRIVLGDWVMTVLPIATLMWFSSMFWGLMIFFEGYYISCLHSSFLCCHCPRGCRRLFSERQKRRRLFLEGPSANHIDMCNRAIFRLFRGNDRCRLLNPLAAS